MSEKTGNIMEIEINDPVLKTEFKVNLTDLYTIISIGKRSFYFNPDGTGQDCNPIIEG